MDHDKKKTNCPFFNGQIVNGSIETTFGSVFDRGIRFGCHEGSIHEEKVDHDEVCFIYLLNLSAKYGYENVNYVYYKDIKSKLNQELKMIYDDNSIGPLLQLLYKARIVDIYYEHE